MGKTWRGDAAEMVQEEAEKIVYNLKVTGWEF